jgi:hypothetical protein
VVAISPHTTRATGTILTAVIYNGDHANHIANAQALNNAKVEGPGTPVVDNRIVRFDGVSGTLIKDGGPLIIGTSSIADDTVTNAKLADMAQNTIKGRVSSGTGDPEDLTATQATSILNPFTSALKGLVPASGGGTTNFLRADGVFANPITSSHPTALVIAGISPGAQLDFSLTAWTAFRTLQFIFEGIWPATNQVSLLMRTSSNGGASFDVGGNDYSWSTGGSVNGGAFAQGAINDFHIRIAGHNTATGNISNNSGLGGYSGVIHLYERLLSNWGRITAEGGYVSAFNNEPTQQTTFGFRKNAADIDAVRFVFSSGNIAGGIIQVYGIP